jgi:hypothetical protein
MQPSVCGKTYYSVTYDHEITLLLRKGRTVLCHSWQCAGAVVDNAHTITGNGGLWFLWRERVAASHIHTRLAAVCGEAAASNVG